MATKTQIEAITEAILLKKRFPDLSDFEVLEHVNLVLRTSFEENTITGNAIIIAYNTGAEAKALRYIDF